MLLVYLRSVYKNIFRHTLSQNPTTTTINFISYYRTTPKTMMPDNQKPHTPTYQVVYHLNSNCTALSLMVRILLMRNRFRFIFKISGLRRYAANHDQKYCTSSAPM